MPVFIAALLGGLINIAATLAGRVLLALGVGFVTYTGFESGLDYLKSQAISNIQSLPADMVQLIAYLGVGQAISIISSAYVVRFMLNGLTGGAIKKMVYR